MSVLKFTKLQVFILIFGSMVIGGFYFFNEYAKNYLVKVNKINSTIVELQKEEYKLNYNILKSSFFLYSSLDPIVKNIKKIKRNIKFLKKELRNIDKNSVAILEDYEKLFNKKVSNIENYQRVNVPVKNSIIFLSNLLSVLPDKNFPNSYKKNVIDEISSIYLVRLTNDMTLMDIDLDYFKNQHFKDKKLESFNKAVVLNLNTILKNYEKYNIYLDNILNSKTFNVLRNLKHNILVTSNQTIKKFTFFAYTAMIIVILSFIGLILLIGIVEKDKKIFYKLAYIDDITGLFNINKFQKDAEKFRAVLILNIDGFKNLNDLYGRDTGNLILKHFAEFIKKDNKQSYRLMADNFAVLSNDKDELYNYFQLVNSKFEEYIKNMEKEFFFELSISGALSDKKPLLATAEIALHEVKKNRRVKCLQYNEKYDNKEKIKINVQKSKILANAIKNGNLVPYFQPIVDIKTGKVAKYEVLARVINNGKAESIFPYLEVAKEGRIYDEITKTMISKTFEMVYNKNIYFSINLSIDDIVDADIIRFIKNKLHQYKGIEKFLSFEILESEAIEDYNRIEKFIKLMKKKNIEFSIDDFGSGYSNFTHIINLDIDYIKIDASLIKNITKDKISRDIVELMTEFAKRHNIKTVAEFVYTKEVLDAVEEIGIDYAQGFYLYEPLEKPLEF